MDLVKCPDCGLRYLGACLRNCPHCGSPRLGKPTMTTPGGYSVAEKDQKQAQSSREEMSQLHEHEKTLAHAHLQPTKATGRKDNKTKQINETWENMKILGNVAIVVAIIICVILAVISRAFREPDEWDDGSIHYQYENVAIP